MEFPKSYFEDEVRDGFYVPAMMKRAWAAQLQVLEDVDKVCRDNDIQYFAEWGTLLGAVRHHGFIPWDDDMDI
ncbi:MAG: LicD family protein, partial [Eubacteriales bacterium]|nr:LicD family protein [Eubacteriales bacterium]